jgi:predicted lipoprotein with Yx(FWY)xxD motif
MAINTVAHRRGYAIFVLLAAIAVAAWLVHARLDQKPYKAPAPKAVGAAAPAPRDPAPAAAAGGNGYGDGDGYGANAPAAGAPGAPAAPKQVGFQASGLVNKKSPRMGHVVTDNKDWTAYRFEGDTKGAETSGCENVCAEAWPPLLANSVDDLKLTGIDRKLVTLLPRADGSKQIALNGWRLYRFGKDGGPNKWLGQAQGGKWFVAAPNGGKNLSCLPSQPVTG